MEADEIKRLRVSAGFTQVRAAAALGVSRGTFSRWENGRARPRPRQLGLLRRTFGVGSIVGAAPSLGGGDPEAEGSALPSLTLPAEDGRVFTGSKAVIAHVDALVGLKGFPDNCVDLVFADPPYNIGKRFADFHDKWPSDEAYIEWCYSWLEECLRLLKPNGSMYVMASTQAMPHIDIWLRKRLTVLSRIVWHYDSSGVQARKYYGSMWEPILHCVHNRQAYTFNTDAIMVEAKTGAKRKLIDYRKAIPTVYNSKKVPGNVWYFPRVRYRMEEYEDHPSQKPEILLSRIIEASSAPGDVVLDPFAGTFTTGAVATRLNRKFIGLESQLKYVKVGLRRTGVASELDGEVLRPPQKTYKRRNNTKKSLPKPDDTQPS